ncbi:MAG: hypothetical protein ACR2JG_12290 [Geodermatophilaceae bacterium]
MTTERIQNADEKITAPRQSSRARGHAKRALYVATGVVVAAAVATVLFYGLLFILLAGSGF